MKEIYQTLKLRSFWQFFIKSRLNISVSFILTFGNSYWELFISQKSIFWSLTRSFHPLLMGFFSCLFVVEWLDHRQSCDVPSNFRELKKPIRSGWRLLQLSVCYWIIRPQAVMWRDWHPEQFQRAEEAH